MKQEISLSASIFHANLVACGWPSIFVYLSGNGYFCVSGILLNYFTEITQSILWEAIVRKVLFLCWQLPLDNSSYSLKRLKMEMSFFKDEFTDWMQIDSFLPKNIRI